jgi:hypothetical protein
MQLLVPITADRACLAFTWRSTIHASLSSPVAVADHCRRNTSSDALIGARTVCGVDATPLVHEVVSRPDSFMLAIWPPPREARDADRCPDCAARLCLRGRKGAGYWDSLIDREVGS